MKKIIMILMALGLMAASSMAAVVMVNSGSTSTNIPASGADTLTLATFSNSGNYVLVGAVTKDKIGSLSTVGGVTYGGTAMTRLGQIMVSEGYEVIIDIYGLATTASSGDVVMSYTFGSNGDIYTGTGFMAMSYSGVAGVGAVSDGLITSSTVTTLTDSITTTATTAGSVVASLFASANDTTYTSSDVQFADGNANSGGLYNNVINSAGTYDLTGTWAAGGGRAAALGVELIAQVPEPATVGMLGLGAIVALLIRRVRA